MFILAKLCCLGRMTARPEIDPTGPLGVAIRKRRRAKGLTQQQFAELADCNVNYVGYVECGKRSVSVRMLGRFLKALNTTLQSLSRTARV